MPEVAAVGLFLPEGPALLGDERVLFTEQVAGRLAVFDGSGVEAVAFTGGAPNSAALGADGDVYVCQNGGVVGHWRSAWPRTPGIQRARLDGAVQEVATHIDGLATVAPNDLAFGPDGRLYVTDPAQPFDPAHRLDAGALFALGAEGGQLLHRVGAVYCNGIGFGSDGQLVWVESYTRRVCTMEDSGSPRVMGELPDGQIPDGFAVAADGRIFIASCPSHGVSVIGPQGEYLGLIWLDENAHPSNCCFDGSVLWATDFGMDWAQRHDAGRLWRVETDAVGASLHTGVPGTAVH